MPLNQVSSVEQLIDMPALLKEVSHISIMVNFSRKLEGNNRRKGRNFVRKFAANYREERIIARKFAVKYHTQQIFAQKQIGVANNRCRENAAKYRRNVVSSEFSSNRPEKPGNSSKFVCITFAQYCNVKTVGIVKAETISVSFTFNLFQSFASPPR